MQSAKMCGWLKHLDDCWINGHRCNKPQWALVLSLQPEEISRVHNWWRTNCLACHDIMQAFMLSIQQHYTYLSLQIFAVYNAFSCLIRPQNYVQVTLQLMDLLMILSTRRPNVKGSWPNFQQCWHILAVAICNLLFIYFLFFQAK